MRWFLLVILSLGSLVANAENIYIENVTVLTMDSDRTHQNVTVAISGDRIIYVGPKEGSPRFDHIDYAIDGTGKFLMPGLAEMHGHLPSSDWSRERQERILFLYLAGGVTTVRGMLGDPIQFELRKQITAGEMDGPTLYLAAPSMNGNSVSSPADGRAKIKRYASQGWDLQKIHPGLTRAEYDAIAEEANKLNFPFGGHVPADVGLERALEAGQISIDHMDGYLQMVNGDTRELTNDDFEKMAALTKASGTWVVPTQELFNVLIGGGDIPALTARPENRYLTPDALASYQRRTANSNANANPLAVENRNRLLKALADADVNLALGSDAPQLFSVPGFSIWREIESMRDAGLTTAQILKSGTSAPGRYFADKDSFGTVTTGARADLILLNSDPREDVTALFHQVGVLAAGRWYSRAAIDAQLDKIARDVAR